MTHPLSPADRAKFAASRAALSLVEPDMKLGLGTGSTANWFVRLLAERARTEGLKLTLVPTSSRTAELAMSLGLKVSNLDHAGWLDMTIDGADEVDPELNLIKGGGAAHLQEKIVATGSDRMVVITDDSKLVQKLGAFPLPVEVTPFGWKTTKAIVEDVVDQADVTGKDVTVRLDKGDPLITDEGNLLLDVHCLQIGDPVALSQALNQIPGVVENGLFLDIADRVMVGYQDGSAQMLKSGGVLSPAEFRDGIDELAFLASLDV